MAKKGGKKGNKKGGNKPAAVAAAAVDKVKDVVYVERKNNGLACHVVTF
jgi:hypothetical protein